MERRTYNFDFQEIQLRSDAGTEEGVITAYASVFNNVDSYDSVIMPGAFRDTLTSGLNKVKVLWNHNSDEPIGKPLVAYEDNKGLFTQFKLSLSVQKARDIFNLIKDGVIDSMSIGFNILDYHVEDQILKIDKVDLWDISPVTFPANPQADIVAVRTRYQEQFFKAAEAPEIEKATGDILRVSQQILAVMGTR